MNATTAGYVHPAIKWQWALDSGGGDRYGWALGHHFAIAETLYAMGEDIPDEWEFRPGLGLNHSLEDIDLYDHPWPDVRYVEEVLNGAWSADDLRRAGNVLSRYVDLLKRHGLDY